MRPAINRNKRFRERDGARMSDHRRRDEIDVDRAVQELRRPPEVRGA